MARFEIDPGSPPPASAVTPAWFCLRSQPKHEHIAAAHLRQEAGLDVFLPRLRFKRATRQGAVWVTEALFPNYLFARFDLALRLRQVCHTRGVRGVVHFGHRWPTIPEAVIEDLRAAVGVEEVRLVLPLPQIGDTVRIVSGAFSGLQAVVTRVMPAKERVAVLLDFLGRQTTVELSKDLVRGETDERRGVF